jgi:hypothetical protein
VASRAGADQRHLRRDFARAHFVAAGPDCGDHLQTESASRLLSQNPDLEASPYAPLDQGEIWGLSNCCVPSAQTKEAGRRPRDVAASKGHPRRREQGHRDDRPAAGQSGLGK